MSESEPQTTPYMANRLNSLDQTVAQDIWLDWDEDEEENESYVDKSGDCDNSSLPVRVKEEPISPSPSPIPDEPSEANELSEAHEAGEPVEPSEAHEAESPVKVTIKTENRGSPSPEREYGVLEELQGAVDAEIDMPEALQGLIGSEYTNDDSEPDPRSPDTPVEEDTDNYNCHFCFRGFTFKEELREHVKMSHSMSIALRCDICLVNFKHRSDYFYHMNQHQTERNMRCDRCLINFRSERKFTEHVLDKHFSGSKYVCEYCDTLFSYKEDLLCHKYEEHTGPQDGYRCDTCRVSFKRKDALETHVTSVHIHNYKCRVCKIVMNSREAFKAHNQMHSRTDKRKFICFSCGSRFQVERTLSLHRLVCLGRRVDSLAFMPVPEEYTKELEAKEKAPEKTAKPKEKENANMTKKPVEPPPVYNQSNVSKVIFDGEKIVTLHQPNAYVGVSEMLIGCDIDPTDTSLRIVTSITPEELAAQASVLEQSTSSCGTDDSLTPDKSPSENSDKLVSPSDSPPSNSSSKLTKKQLNNINSSQISESFPVVLNADFPSSSRASSENSVSNTSPTISSSNQNNNALKNTNTKRLILSSSSTLTAESNDESALITSSRHEVNVNPSTNPLERYSVVHDETISERTVTSFQDTSDVRSTDEANPSTSNAVSAKSSSSNSNVKINKGLKAQSAHSNVTEQETTPPDKVVGSGSSSQDNCESTSQEGVSVNALNDTAGGSATSKDPDSDDEPPMTFAEIMETCEAVSTAVRDSRKRDNTVLKLENGEEGSYLKNFELPERCLKAIKAQKLPRLMKKPRLLSENINQALSYRIVKAVDNFVCNFCKAEFAYKYDLVKHQRTHTANFKCDKCPAAFVKKEELAQHTLSTHFRQSPRSEPNLLANLFTEKATQARRPTVVPQMKASDQIFTCDNCEANFGFEAELIYHMRIHGDEFKCNKCRASFREKSELAKHMLSVHF